MVLVCEYFICEPKNSSNLSCWKPLSQKELLGALMCGGSCEVPTYVTVNEYQTANWSFVRMCCWIVQHSETVFSNGFVISMSNRIYLCGLALRSSGTCWLSHDLGFSLSALPCCCIDKSPFHVTVLCIATQSPPCLGPKKKKFWRKSFPMEKMLGCFWLKQEGLHLSVSYQVHRMWRSLHQIFVGFLSWRKQLLSMLDPQMIYCSISSWQKSLSVWQRWTYLTWQKTHWSGASVWPTFPRPDHGALHTALTIRVILVTNNPTPSTTQAQINETKRIFLPILPGCFSLIQLIIVNWFNEVHHKRLQAPDM